MLLYMVIASGNRVTHPYSGSTNKQHVQNFGLNLLANLMPILYAPYLCFVFALSPLRNTLRPNLAINLSGIWETNAELSRKPLQMQNHTLQT